MVARMQGMPAGALLLREVDWETYERLRDIEANWHLRMIYDRGDLEIRSTSYRQQRLKSLIRRLIQTFTLELNIPIQSTGFTTWKNPAFERSLEADESFYIQNEAIVRGKRDYDPETDPPPDLAVEVEITTGVLPRMKIYAALGVPEVWRYDGERLRIHILSDEGHYEQHERSVALPLLPPEEVERFLRECADANETAWIRTFRQWVRETVLKDTINDT